MLVGTGSTGGRFSSGLRSMMVCCRSANLGSRIGGDTWLARDARLSGGDVVVGRQLVHADDTQRQHDQADHQHQLTEKQR